MNKRIHIVFVPLLIVSTLAMLSEVPSRQPLPTVPQMVMLFYCLYYIVLDVKIGVSFIPFAVTLYLFSHALIKYVGQESILPVAFSLHILSWVAQFFGHFAFEGKSPAIFNSIIQSMLAAPITIWLELLFSFGFMLDVRAKLNRSRVVAKARRASAAEN